MKNSRNNFNLLFSVFFFILSSNVYSFSPIHENLEDEVNLTMLLNQANQSFENANWKEAKYAYFNYINQSGAQIEINAEIYAQYATSCLNAGDYHRAIEAFSKYLRICKCEEKAEYAKWNRAVAAMGADMELAKKYLKEISLNRKSRFQDDAKSLLHLVT